MRSRKGVLLRLMVPYRTLLITALAALAYGLIAGGLPPMVLAGLATYFTLLTGALNALNSWSDIVGDAISWRDRPLVTGEVSPSTALRFSAGLIGTLGLLLAALSIHLAAPIIFVIGVIDTLLIVAYSVRPIRLKRFALVPGLIVGAHVTIFPALATWASAEWSRPFPSISMAFLFLLAYVAMLTEDFTDVAGDRASGDRSLTIVMGAYRARWVAAGLYLLAGGIAPLIPGLWDPRLFLPASAALGVAGLASTRLESDSPRTKAIYHLDTIVVTLVGILITIGLLQRP